MVCQPSLPPGSLGPPEDGGALFPPEDGGGCCSLDVPAGPAFSSPPPRFTSPTAIPAPTMITIASTPKIMGALERLGAGLKSGSPKPPVWYGLYCPYGCWPYGSCCCGLPYGSVP